MECSSAIVLLLSLLPFAQGFLTNAMSALHACTRVDFPSQEASASSEDIDAICVVGGGLAGLSTAAALHHMAHRKVKVLEQFSWEEFASDTAGAAIQLGPNGLKALHAIGGDTLVSTVQSEGTCLKGHAIFTPNGDSPMVIPDNTAEEHDGIPQVLIRWSKLRGLLRKLLPPDIIQTGVDDINGYKVNSQDGTVSVSRSSRDEGDIANRYPFIVAADGIYSTFGSLIRRGDTETRTLLKGNERETRRSNIIDRGRVNIKAVVPGDLEADGFEAQTTYSFFAGSTACFAGPAGDGYTYWAISIADDPDKGSIFEETNNDKHLVKSKLTDTLKSLQDPKCQFAIDLIERTNADAVLIARSEERDIGSTLVSQDGAVVLVGDAAHAMSPSYGVSASFAFEDAATLVRCLMQENTTLKALQRYSRLRLDRCLEMQRRSSERTAKATRGEPTEDISKWIFKWHLDDTMGALETS